jgi:hypothetical protein
MTAAVFTGALVTFLCWGCWFDLGGISGPAPKEEGGAQYYYVGYDTAGGEIVRGLLVIVRGDSTIVTGTWNFRLTDSRATMIGPQVGSGTLMGTWEDSNLSLNLNPQYADNNVILIGTCSNRALAGKWQYIGFAGVLNEGTFRAALLPAAP